MQLVEYFEFQRIAAVSETRADSCCKILFDAILKYLLTIYRQHPYVRFDEQLNINLIKKRPITKDH